MTPSLRMSQRVREEIESALASLMQCSAYDAQERLQRLLGYKVDAEGFRIVAPKEGKEQS